MSDPIVCHLSLSFIHFFFQVSEYTAAARTPAMFLSLPFKAHFSVRTTFSHIAKMLHASRGAEQVGGGGQGRKRLFGNMSLN